MSESPPVCDLGWKAADFDLPGTDGERYALDGICGKNGLLVVFMCNHCPYVKAVRTRLVRDCEELKTHGIGSIAISSNDVVAYPEDSFENMKRIAREWQLPFPYVFDESQEVARGYGAICTPDFFGFNADLELQYRGRLDASGRNPEGGGRRELFEAMRQVAETGRGPKEQIPSVGCSIKWARVA